jgi:hypothetical protein
LLLTWYEAMWLEHSVAVAQKLKPAKKNAGGLSFFTGGFCEQKPSLALQALEVYRFPTNIGLRLCPFALFRTRKKTCMSAATGNLIVRQRCARRPSKRTNETPQYCDYRPC